MISVLVRKLCRHRRPADKEGKKKGGLALAAIEELMFWGGLGTLAFGAGTTAVLGGVAVSISIVLALMLVFYA